MKLLIISGSTGNPSHTNSALEYLESYLLLKNHEVVFYNLSEKKLPFADAKYHHSPLEFPNAIVQDFVYHAQSCDAFIIGTPNYHNSFSGLLKNALDILNIKHFYLKPVGLVTHSGGIRSTEPLGQLRLVIRGQQGLAIPTQIATCNSDYINKETGFTLENNLIIERAIDFCDQLIEMTTKLK
ncbi:NADPH-dependent FMN reductase [Peribacillus butanolivorans]|uniref:NADPH-dependent FMN reductase n=1 Tax=Peribacillus butanolivorans TaxID=421767 RepID=UPI003D2E67B0